MRSARLRVGWLIARTGRMRTHSSQISIACGLALVASLLAAGWAPGDDELAARGFRASLAPRSNDAVRISGDVLSNCPYRVTNVRLEIEGLNSDDASMGRTFAWAVGDLPPGGRTYFATEPI